MEHFHITNLADANIMIAQPANYSDPNAVAPATARSTTSRPGVESGKYDGIKPRDLAYTNCPTR